MTAPELEEQIDHYEADAEAYQRWLDELASPANRSAVAVAARARRSRLAALLDGLAPFGRMLELAAGTGRLSALVAPHCDHLALVDSSPTSLAIARERLDDQAGLTVERADLFDWQPKAAAFDTVGFAAWLHHVPLDRFEDYWAMVGRALAPGGRVLFDFADARGARTDDVPPVPATGHAAYHQPRSGTSVRDLDGRRWTVVHQVWDPDALVGALDRLGWQMEVALVEDDGFHWAIARRGSDG